jgi:hypothetical protein
LNQILYPIPGVTGCPEIIFCIDWNLRNNEYFQRFSHRLFGKITQKVYDLFCLCNFKLISLDERLCYIHIQYLGFFLKFEIHIKARVWDNFLLNFDPFLSTTANKLSIFMFCERTYIVTFIYS